MRLAIDAMGNDRGPLPILQGVGNFLQKDRETAVTLVGNRQSLEEIMPQVGLQESDRLNIVHATQVMEMHEKVQNLREKRDSSIVRLVTEVKEGRADGMVALGNTAAAVGATCMGLRNLEGVRRPGIALPLPTKPGGVCVLMDMGANTVAKAEHLMSYGIMASIYSEQVLHVKNPRVGLLNVGEERGKGNDILRDAFALLEKSPVNFVGNVEGGDVFSGSCDVVVCDGFIGNVVLKVSEELGLTVATWMKEGFRSNWLSKIGALLSKGAFNFIRKRMSYDEYGGAPLLGVNGICVIGHGRSNATAVQNALRVARESVEGNINGKISSRLTAMKEEAAQILAAAGTENI
jgi:glycerol-3-phosphate acyltransferase PlsX